jgi:hypothetical protein
MASTLSPSVFGYPQPEHFFNNILSQSNSFIVLLISRPVHPAAAVKYNEGWRALSKIDIGIAIGIELISDTQANGWREFLIKIKIKDLF